MKVLKLIVLAFFILLTPLCSVITGNDSLPPDAAEALKEISAAFLPSISEQISSYVSEFTEKDYIKMMKKYSRNTKKIPADILDNMKVVKMTYYDLNHAVILKKLGFLKNESKDKKLNLRNAIIRFQSSINEAVSGKLTELDMRVLEAAAIKKAYEAEDIVETPPTNDLWIVINKSSRILTLYKRNKVIKKYPVAIGKNPDTTPTGKFTIVIKAKNPAWGGGGYASPVKGGSPKNPLGYRWMGLSIKGGGSYGIHGNNKPYSIGTNASHGCIRMINSDVEELFDLIPKNTIVWIGYKGKLKEWGIEQKSVCFEE
ncbi:MAG: L,D-transpeptidase [Bacillota bacterium]